MNAGDRALCYFYRHPPADSGVRPLSYRRIARLVVKKNGTQPSSTGVYKAVAEFRTIKRARGRRAGWRKTTKDEDKIIMSTFHKLRPPGHGVTARGLHRALPLALKRKVSPRTLRNRLAAKGYRPQRKLEKADLNLRCRKARLAFCRAHCERQPSAWKFYLQGCGDLCEFRYYPRTLRARFRRYSAAWTYMTVGERTKPAFLKPKRPFKRTEIMRTQKGKVFGFTASSGRQLAVVVPLPFTSEDFAVVVRRHLGPLLQAEFPLRRHHRILLDGEPLLHAPPAQGAFAQFGIEVLPNWPPYSPDLNPEEHVWAWVLEQLQRPEHETTSFAAFTAKLVSLVHAYPGKAKLVASMSGRLDQCIKRKGEMTKF